MTCFLLTSVYIFFYYFVFSFFFQAEDGIRAPLVTGVQTCALPISSRLRPSRRDRGDGRSREVLPRARGQPARARRQDAVSDDRRSEERRVGKECRSRWSQEACKKNRRQQRH